MHKEYSMLGPDIRLEVVRGEAWSMCRYRVETRCGLCLGKGRYETGLGGVTRPCGPCGETGWQYSVELTKCYELHGHIGVPNPDHEKASKMKTEFEKKAQEIVAYLRAIVTANEFEAKRVNRDVDPSMAAYHYCANLIENELVKGRE